MVVAAVHVETFWAMARTVATFVALVICSNKFFMSDR